MYEQGTILCFASSEPKPMQTWFRKNIQGVLEFKTIFSHLVVQP